jgi:uncharacterized protein (DUF1778 family)
MRSFNSVCSRIQRRMVMMIEICAVRASFMALALSGETPYISIATERPKMRQEQTRTARIEARIAPDALAIVKRAAEIQGRSVSDFVVAAAQEAANRTIAEAHIIKLSIEDQRAFAEAILNPAEPAPTLRRAFARHRELIKESR